MWNGGGCELPLSTCSPLPLPRLWSSLRAQVSTLRGLSSDLQREEGSRRRVNWISEVCLVWAECGYILGISAVAHHFFRLFLGNRIRLACPIAATFRWSDLS
ncbi:hypothetical protein BHM03_00003080 [Ensete ventricosum]|nr:hypothetical protein BHM03_00003080 [Ensete ventricosum]